MKNGVRVKALLGIFVCLALFVFSLDLNTYQTWPHSAVSISAVSRDYVLLPVSTRTGENQRDSKGYRTFIYTQKASSSIPAEISVQHYFHLSFHSVPSVVESIFKGDIQLACRLLDIPPPLSVLSWEV